MSEKGGRWIWDDKTQSLVDAGEYYRRKAEGRDGAPTVIPDIAAFVSPIDGKEITSRSALRDHEKRHNVIQMGNDIKPQDYNVAGKRQTSFNERAVEAAYRKTVQKLNF